MKWIGQHIWNFISRFRNDVYVETLEEQDQEFSVMVSSNGKLTKSNYPIERSRIRVRNDEGSTIPLGSALYCKGYADNRILVGLCNNTDASKMPCIGIAVAEMNTTTTKDNYGITQGLLTTTIPVTGALLVNLPLYVGNDGYLVKAAPTALGSIVQCVGVVVKTDAAGNDCEVSSVSITNQTRDRDASGIKGLQDVATDIKSEADLKFYIDSDDGAGTNKFYWYDHTSSIMELDNSGNLQLDGGITTGSTSFVNSSGVVQVATQGTIDHDSLANFVLEEHYRWDSDIQSTATINHANLSSDTGSESEVLVINDGDAVWGHPEKIHLQVRNDEGSTIPAGAPLYSKGEIGGSNRIKVGICDADDSAKMPCIGLAEVAMNTTSTKDNFAITQGVYNTNIAGFTSLSDGDILYVDTSGSMPYLTKTKPTGESSLIQNVGIVLKTNGTICQALQVSAIGRTNDVPNLNSGYIFYGNGSNQAASTQLSTLLPPDLTVDGAGTVNANNYTNTTYSEATSSDAGLMSTTHHDKLDGIETGATADQTQADINALNITAASCTGNAATADALTSGNKTITGGLTVTGQLSATRRKFIRTATTTHFDVQGDILYFGSGSTTQGDLCYLKEDGTWGQADADGAAIGDNADRDAMGMLAIALGTNPLVDGMFIRGIITMDYDLGDVGNPIYVKTTAGGMTHTPPSASGDFVRVLGYCLDDDHGIMYFNPDNTWVEIA